MKKIIILFFAVYTNQIYAVESKPKQTQGFFEGFNWGDYLYLEIKDSKNKKVSFYCNDPKCADWEMNQSKFVGKKVIVTWREKLFYIKQLKEKIKIKEAIKLEIKK